MDNFFFKQAIKEAKKAFLKGEIPVGAVIVKDNVIIAKSHNKKEKYQNPIAHAEILAIEKASKVIKNWRLHECDMYVTLEPCLMCFSAIKQARIRNVFYILKNNIFKNENIDIKNNFTIVKNNILEKEVRNILKSFFLKARKNNKLKY